MTIDDPRNDAASNDDSFMPSERERRESLATAYAMDELDAGERAEAERLIADPNQAEMVRQVAEVRAIAGALKAEFDGDAPVRSAELRRAVLAAVAGPDPSPRRSSGRGWMRFVAAIAASMLVAFVLPAGRNHKQPARERLVADARAAAASSQSVDKADEAKPGIEIEHREAKSQETARSLAAAPGAAAPPPAPFAKDMASENGTTRLRGAASRRESDRDLVFEKETLAEARDSAAVAQARRFLDSGRMPPPDAVRIEELVNCFAYDYPNPEGDTPFSVTVDATECPWNRGHRLVRIGLRGRDASKALVEQGSVSTAVIAEKVKMEVAFNPAEVMSYRPLGHEDRVFATRDFRNDTKEAGEIVAGNRVTALYEIALRDEATGGDRDLLTVKLQWNRPGESESMGLEVPLNDRGTAFAEAPADLRFAAAVAAFGMILRNNDQKGDASLPMVAAIASDSLGRDEGGHRAEFLDLVRKAESLR
ncbi:MAG: von Willebrand factor type A domain-containing protein [Planctomycetia bacterium]